MTRFGKPRAAALIALLSLSIAACAGRQAAPDAAAKGGPAADEPDVASVQRGRASWYGGRFHGRKTASGERFDKRAMTAAHRRLPFGTRVRVTNRKSGAQVIVRINDRGPYGGGNRIIDLSRGAAERLDMIADGIVPVKLEILRE